MGSWAEGDARMNLALELRRHAPVGRPRRRPAGDRPGGLAHLYASPTRRLVPDLYLTDRAEGRRGGGFRWFFSTCLAATVGAVAIAAVIFGSMEARDTRGDMLDALRRQLQPIPTPARRAPAPVEAGLAWALPKVDKLHTTTGAVATKYIVHESIEQKRGNRSYTQKKPYARIVVRLAAVTPDQATEIPRLDPAKLLAGPAGSGETDADRDGAKPVGGEVTVRHVELVGTILPGDDGQELDGQEVAEIVRRASGATLGADDALIRPTFQPEGAAAAAEAGQRRAQVRTPEPLAPNTSVLEKSVLDSDDPADDAETEGRRTKVKLTRGETLGALLRRNGADAWLARSFVEAARQVQADGQLTPDLDIELSLLPSLTQAGKVEPTRITVTTETGEHRLTIYRNPAGELVASTTPVETGRKGQTDMQAATLYASLYHGALAQGIPPDTIEQILRVHVPETDFRRRARGSDSVELFFDLKDEEKGAESAPGDLLFTSMSVAGEPRRYWRFRTPDGVVDYYDANGANSRRFLMKRPFRGEEVKFNNGFGMRHHPLLGGLRMHTGIDYAGPINTPILAAGSGVIEEARFKGQNGNYVRIRHANGYQTTYSHLNRFASGTREGARVVQGQVLGYLGSTGLSTGPHLHFEVLIGNRFVDPMKLPDQRERRLAGKQLSDFHRERRRIDDLMRRLPVRVVQTEAR